MLAELRLLDEVAAGLDAVIVRPPWFYGPYQPARQTTFFRMVRTGRFPIVGDGRQRRSMVYVDNLVDGVVRAELRRVPAGTRLVDRRRPAVRGQRDRRHRRRGPRAEGSTWHGGNSRLPALAGRIAAAPTPRSSAATATSSSCTCSARWARRSPATSRRAPARARLRTDGRPRRGDAPQRPLVPGRGDRAVTTAGHRRQRLLRQRCSSTTCSRRRHVRVLDIDDRTGRSRRASTSSSPTSATATPSPAPSTASTSSTTTSPRCRSPAIRGAALGQRRRHGQRLLEPAATPASPRSSTPRRARCSASRHQPGAADDRARAAGAVRPRQARRRVGVPARRRRRPRRHDRAAAHDPRPRPPRHLRHPVRLDRRRRRPVRARRRHQPLPVRPRRRPRRRLPARRRHARCGDLQRRHRPLRHDARGARARLCRHAGTGAASALPAGPASAAMRDGRGSASPRSPRTTG